MRCPFCGSAETKVIDSRFNEDSYSIKRRRECLLCGARSPHLKGQKIQVAESDEEGNLNIDWSGIFIDKK